MDRKAGGISDAICPCKLGLNGCGISCLCHPFYCSNTQDIDSGSSVTPGESEQEEEELPMGVIMVIFVIVIAMILF